MNWTRLREGDDSYQYHDLEPRDGEKRWLVVGWEEGKLFAKVRYDFLKFTYIDIPPHITDLEEAKAVALMIAKMS